MLWCWRRLRCRGARQRRRRFARQLRGVDGRVDGRRHRAGDDERRVCPRDSPLFHRALARRPRLAFEGDEILPVLPRTCTLVGGLLLDRQALVEGSPRRTQVEHITCLFEQEDVGQVRAAEVGRPLIRLDRRRCPLLRPLGLAAVVGGRAVSRRHGGRRAVEHEEGCEGVKGGHGVYSSVKRCGSWSG